MSIEESVHNAINDIVVSIGYEIVDIEYKRHGDDMHLTVFCDRVGGFGLDDCEKITHAIDQALDQLNPTNDKPYILNVSSPGLDRPFRTDRDYQRNIGKGVEVYLHNHINKKMVVSGVLKACCDGIVVLDTKKGVLQIPQTNINYTIPLVVFR